MGGYENPDNQKERNRFIYVDIYGYEFIFDKIGYELFKSEFATDSYKIMIDEKGYLSRRNLYNSEWNPQYFHRWLKFRRTSKEDIDKQNIQVHHKNGKVNDNRIRNLVFVDREQHHKIRKKKKAYKTFCEKFYEDNPDASPQSCSWHWAKFKEDNEID